MGIIYQKDKRVGITYAYESKSYWDKEKKQPRSIRTLIGKLDEATGEIVPTRERKPVLPEPVFSRTYGGATYLFDEIAKELGVWQDMCECFPYIQEQILSIAYYVILEDRNPLSRFPKWAATHSHPYGKEITSQQSSSLFAGITENAKHEFFMRQSQRKKEREYWFYDATSISSYSKTLEQVRYGHNNDHEHLEQINLAVLCGEESQLPFYYRKLPGNITDVKTVKNLIADISDFTDSHVKLVMDRGFYSEDNVNAMLLADYTFLIGVKMSLSYVREGLDQVREEIRTFDHYHQDEDLYMDSVVIPWHDTQGTHAERSMFLHLYYSGEKALDDERTLHKKLRIWKEELEGGKRQARNEKSYKQYFDAETTPALGVHVSVNQQALEHAKRNYGYFAMISNEINDSAQALRLYRNKDLIEKTFENMKDRLSLRRVHVSSEKSLDGKLFVEFVALILLSDINRRMRKANLYKKYTMQGMLDQIDLIECFEQKGKPVRYGEITKKQVDIYHALTVLPPS